MVYPFTEATQRLYQYELYDKLAKGEHKDAFIKESPLVNQEYQRLKYIVANFLGLEAKIFADFLFGTPPQISVTEGNNSFLDAIIQTTKLDTINYESALQNARRGDAVYRLRVETKEGLKPVIRIDNISPFIYFPEFENNTINTEPIRDRLAWVIDEGEKRYLVQEIHTVGYIEYKVNELEKNGKIGAIYAPSKFGLPDNIVETKVSHSLVFHIPNYRDDNEFWGTSDFDDLISIQYGLNNRLTRIGDILDKHSQPILTLPTGILDENGRFDSRNRVMEILDGQKEPQYLTWDSSLESAFKEVDKLLELGLMIAEINPEVLGLGKGGQAESGRALKFKLLRTLAKKDRKARYYENVLKDLLYTAQELCINWNIEINGAKLQGQPQIPQIKFSDTQIQDFKELVEIEGMRLEQGTTTVVDSIIRLDNVDQNVAEEKAKSIEAETSVKSLDDINGSTTRREENQETDDDI